MAVQIESLAETESDERLYSPYFSVKAYLYSPRMGRREFTNLIIRKTVTNAKAQSIAVKCSGRRAPAKLPKSLKNDNPEDESLKRKAKGHLRNNVGWKPLFSH